MGGILRLWVLPVSCFSLSGKILTITDSSAVVAIDLQKDSASYSEELKRSFAGQHYEVELSGIFPGASDDASEKFNWLTKISRVCVLFIDGDGNYRLSGTPDVPLRITINPNTGEQASSLKHISITFSGRQKNMAIYTNNPF